MENKNQPLTEALFYILLAVRRPVHGYGIILELFEFTGLRHEPFSGQPLAALLFQSGNKEETKELLAHAGITAAEYPEGLLLKGPDRETLWVQTADPDLIH